MSAFYTTPEYSEIEANLAILTSQVWDHAVKMPEIREWLEQFNGQVLPEYEEKRYMLIALTKFMFFNQQMIREMLISLYRDHFKSPLIQSIRKENNNTLDFEFLNKKFIEELALTRFIGIGNAAESGTHLLYIFRQVNELKNSLFSDLNSTFELKEDQGIPKWYVRNETIKRYIFFDDFVGGGTQAKRRLEKILQDVKTNNPLIEIKFLSIVSTTHGLNILNQSDMFNGNGSCLFELDPTYKSCLPETRYFHKVEDFSIEKFKSIVHHYGAALYPEYPLGFGGCELLIGFFHNTPNNTLPIFWKEGFIQKLNTNWYPIFKRFEKNYGSVRS